MTAPVVQGYVRASDGTLYRLGGPQGQQGPPGPAGGSYRHVQAIPATIWTITHGLEHQPSVTVVDSTGEKVLGSVRYTTDQVVITFAAQFSGEAYLS